MNEEYLIGIFRKAIIEAKAEAMSTLGNFVLDSDSPDRIHALVSRVEQAEALLRDEKTLRVHARSVSHWHGLGKKP